MIQKSQDFILMEKCFEKIQQKANVDSCLDSIKRTIERRYDLNINISIVKNRTNKFFGMTIYPSITTMDKLIETILLKKTHSDLMIDVWKENKNWTLEIDSILLTDKNLNANPAEIVSILLHEIGHTIFSNTIPQRIGKVLRIEMLNINYQLRELCKKSKIRKLFELSIIEACGQKEFNYTNPDSELAADRFVVKENYGIELDNFISKLITVQGNSLTNRDDGEKDKEVEIFVKWAIENIVEIKHRKTKLKHLIDVQIMRTPSEFVRDVLKKIKDTFTRETGEKFKESIFEQTLFSVHDRIINESILNFIDSIGKVKKINQVDIDVICVQMEKIENQDDKIYMLDQIYDKLELVNLSIEMIDTGKGSKVSQSKQTLTGLKTQLEKMRTQVLGVKVKEKQYGLFIKYPVGYEG